MNKKQRHLAKIEKRQLLFDLANALRAGYLKWQAANTPIRQVQNKGDNEVMKSLAAFIAERIPALGAKATGVAVRAGVGVSPRGVHIDFKECAAAIIRERAKRAAA